jgi:glycosyltransferase involved in cell wall biosynthesis
MRAVPDAAISLDVFGVVQSEGHQRLLDELRSLAHGDARIGFFPALPASDVIPRLAEYDLVAVPSQWMETGPLVVLEAFAAGVPVIGSNLGGIADKVRDDIDGILVRPYDSVAVWAEALRACATDADRLHRLRTGVRPPRSMTAVAAEMDRVYRGVTAPRSPDSRALETTA